MKTISPQALSSQFLGRPDPVVLDLRSDAEYAKARIPGSKSLPLSRIPVIDFNSIINRSTPEIYLICRSGRLSSIAFDTLDGVGGCNVFVVEGGLIAWMRAGLPLERAAVKEVSLDRQIYIAAGSLVLLGVVLAWFVHPAFVGLPAFVGGELAFSGLSGWRGMRGLLARAPWNRSEDDLVSYYPMESST